MQEGAKSEEKDLQLQIELGQALEQMVTTPGWNTHFAVWLNGLQKSFETGILTAKKLEDFIAAQQNINLIDKIFSYVKINIEIGKGASQKLAGTKHDKTEEEPEG